MIMVIVRDEGREGERGAGRSISLMSWSEVKVLVTGLGS